VYPGKGERSHHALKTERADILNLRDVVHSGYKVVGDKSLKLFTVRKRLIKAKPLYEYVK
jgi:hypothetical protein